jgi:3-ketosteroid 9alpha-monooxygenase subunit A
VTTETAGIREIDAGALPDRYARGWHCLGPVQDYLDGKPHGIEIFGTMLVVFADSNGEVKVLDGYCRHMGGNLAQGTIKGDEVACPFHDWRWGGDGKCSTCTTLAARTSTTWAPLTVRRTWIRRRPTSVRRS